MDTKWVVTHDAGIGLGGTTRVVLMMGVFDTKTEAERYVKARAEHAMREPEDYMISEANYKPEPGA
jgi:hypothetical protein